MRILHITDSHGTVKSPESRKDIYYVSFLKKFYELGYVIKKYNIDMVIHTGDLFHTARVSDKFAGQLANLINAFGVPVYVVPGNHDIEGYSIDTIDQTKLGLLAKTKTVTILDRDHPVQILTKQGNEEFTIAISGQEYYANIDEGNQTDFDMRQDEADLNILAIHGYITPDSQHPNIKHTMANTITTDADIILAGHYHRQFEFDGSDFSIYNPGSLMRVDQTEYNKTHSPQYGILDITLDAQDEIVYSYAFHKLAVAQPSTTVFDYNTQYQNKQSSITLDGFKNSLSNSMPIGSQTTNILHIIDDVCKNALVDASVKTLAINSYNATLQMVPDEFEAQPGYIESPMTKKIDSIELMNFQSHGHSVINFNEGLNIFIGESNAGKTTIFRAILWAVDNQPLGTDFIMAGQVECSVKINYTDGTYIKRWRSMKDTGYYEVQRLDESNNLVTQIYKGFTNAVPVEVANVHQMPKVNITKDLETHLNVITQLEGPFLLTESPTVKAAAIGRITGTHVIDQAIKDNNSVALSNKKMIKAYQKDQLEKENELKAMPDTDMMQLFFDTYKSIIAYIKNQQAFIDKAELLISNLYTNEQEIGVQQILLSKYKAVTQFIPVVKQASVDYSFLDKANKAFNEYQNCLVDTEMQSSALDINKTIALMRPMVAKAASCKFNYDRYSNTYERYLITDEKITQTTQETNMWQSYKVNLELILLRTKSLKEYISEVLPSFTLTHEINLKVKTTTKEKKTNQKAVKDIQAKIFAAKEERDNLIVDNHICPCCGQEINDSHIEVIAEFMKN